MSSEGYRKTSSNGTQARLVSIGSTRLVSLGVNKHDAAIENTVCAVASLPRSGDLPVHPQIAPLSSHLCCQFSTTVLPPNILPPCPKTPFIPRKPWRPCASARTCRPKGRSDRRQLFHHKLVRTTLYLRNCIHVVVVLFSFVSGVW
jgi:hypothetical protein